jgi:hypothetical protein
LTQTTFSRKIATTQIIPDLAAAPLHATECGAIAIAAHEPRTNRKRQQQQREATKETKKRGSVSTNVLLAHG